MRAFFVHPATRLGAYIFTLLLLYLPTGGGDAIAYLRQAPAKAGDSFVFLRWGCYLLLLFILWRGRTTSPLFSRWAVLVCLVLALFTEVRPLAELPYIGNNLPHFYAFWTSLRSLLPRSIYLTPGPAIFHATAIIILAANLFRHQRQTEEPDDDLPVDEPLDCDYMVVPGEHDRLPPPNILPK